MIRYWFLQMYHMYLIFGEYVFHMLRAQCIYEVGMIVYVQHQYYYYIPCSRGSSKYVY
jgi:hypothetical protein